MKSKLIAKTLGLFALASVAVTSPLAHANDWQDDNNRNNDYSESGDDRSAYPMERLREGFRFAQIVNDRQDQQLDAIMAGVVNNGLSKNMFVRLMQEQKNIRALERSFMSARFMTEPEFRRLNRSLDVAERNIRVAQQSDHHQRYSQRPWANF